MAIRVIGLTQGAAYDPLASSGLNRTVFGALSKRLELVRVLDVTLHGWQRGWNALSTWRPQRGNWRERYDVNVWGFQRHSQLAGELLADLDGSFDLAFQLRALYTPGRLPARWPYAMLLDNTYALSERYYHPWAVVRGRELPRWRALEQEAYQCARFVFTHTQLARRSLIEDYGLPESQVIYAGTGCNFDLASLPKEKVTDDGTTLLLVGKDFERKGVDTLLKAFEIVSREQPGAHLLLAGSDARIEQPGVEVLGKIYDRNLLMKVYERASIFVLPSHYEPCGNAVVEAMAFHLPCVVSSAGGMAELVQDGRTGFIVPPRDPDRLAGCILDLMSDARLRQQMGLEGAKYVREELNWERVAERMVPHLQQGGHA